MYLYVLTHIHICIYIERARGTHTQLRILTYAQLRILTPLLLARGMGGGVRDPKRKHTIFVPLSKRDQTKSHERWTWASLAALLVVLVSSERNSNAMGLW